MDISISISEDNSSNTMHQQGNTHCDLPSPEPFQLRLLKAKIQILEAELLTLSLQLSLKATVFNSGISNEHQLPDAKPHTEPDLSRGDEAENRTMESSAVEDVLMKVVTEHLGFEEAPAAVGRRRRERDITPTVAVPHEPQLPRIPLGNKRGRCRTELMTASALLYFIYTHRRRST